MLHVSFMPFAICRHLAIVLAIPLALYAGSDGSPPGDPNEMAGRNAFVFQQIMASEGFFVIRERRTLPKNDSGVSSFEVFGLLAANEGTLRLVVSWRVGAGKRATYAAIVSQGESGQALYSKSNYKAEGQGLIAYDFDSYATRLFGPSAWQWQSISSGTELPELGAFTLESGGFTDFWQRVD